VSSPSYGVYVVEYGQKRAISSEAIFLSYSYKWADILKISDAEMASIPDGTPLGYNVYFREGRLVSSPSQGVYLVTDGQKRAISSEAIFLSYSYKWADILKISDAEMGMIPSGAPLGLRS
jgi:hypothetical protein